MQLLTQLRRTRRLVIPAVLLILVMVGPREVAAHPLGNFSVNRYSRLEIEATSIQLLYVVDMAEIPTFQERPAIDTNGDGRLSEVEETRYLSHQVDSLRRGLTLQANGRPLLLEPEAQTITFLPGAGDLPTLRLEITFQAALPGAGVITEGRYEDTNYSDRLGWQEIVVRDGSSATLLEASVPSEDISGALRQYPQDLLQSPLRVNQATFRFQPSTTSSTRTDASLGTLAAPTAGNERFSENAAAALIAGPQSGPGILFVSILAAFVLGAAHALTPGHGKTIVGAFLVGSRGTARHALFLGLTTTVTHTIGIFLLGLVVLFASQYVLPEQLFPWLGVTSGLLVVAIGASLFRSRWQGWHARVDHQEVTEMHTHFGIAHRHLPPDQRTGWRSLLALGISGGLLPCPSALVLLLSAIALQRLMLGLVLILIFSLGLASVLTGIGLTLVYASRLFQRLPGSNSRLLAALPLFSALFITVAGLIITGQALLQTGLL